MFQILRAAVEPGGASKWLPSWALRCALVGLLTTLHASGIPGGLLLAQTLPRYGDCPRLQALARLSRDTSTLTALTDYADEASLDNLTCANLAAHHALGLPEELLSPTQVLPLYTILAYNHTNLERYDSARHYNSLRAAIAEEVGNLIEVHDAQLLFGSIAVFGTHYDSALHYLRLAVASAEAAGDLRGMSRAYEMMARTSVTKEAAAEGRALAAEALRLGREVSDTAAIVTALNTLVQACLLQRRYGEAVPYSREEVTLARALGSDIDLAEALLAAADVATFTGRLAEAEAALTEALELHEVLYGERHIGGSGYHELANLHGARGDFSAQATALRQLLASREEGGFAVQHARFLADITEAYDSLGRYDSAYHFARLLVEEQDSLYARANANALTDLRVRYQTKERERDLVEQRCLLAVERRSRLLTLGLAGLGFAAAAIVGYLALQLRRRDRDRAALVHEVHHRVKNNLQVVSSLLYLQRRHVEDPAAVAAIQESQHRVEAMGLIHQRLYTRDRLTSVRMDSYLAELTDALQEAFGRHRTDVTLEVEPVELPVQLAIELGLIANELISNSFKYAGAGGRLWVRLVRLNAERYRFEVADDGGRGAGGGHRAEDESAATSQGTGFGSQLVEMLSQKLNTAPEIRRGPDGYATVFEFSVDSIG